MVRAVVVYHHFGGLLVFYQVRRQSETRTRVGIQFSSVDRATIPQ